MIGTYLILTIAIGCLALWPEETIATFTIVSFKIQIYALNLKMKWTAWRIYRQLVKLTKEAGFPHPGPFKYTNLWERD